VGNLAGMRETTQCA